MLPKMNPVVQPSHDSAMIASNTLELGARPALDDDDEVSVYAQNYLVMIFKLSNDVAIFAWQTKNKITKQ